LRNFVEVNCSNIWSFTISHCDIFLVDLLYCWGHQYSSDFRKYQKKKPCRL